MSRGQSAPAERRDFGHVYRRGDTYWIRYSVGGRRYRESTHSGNAHEAEKMLARRQAELGLGAFTAPDVKRTTFEDLARIIRDDYAVNGRRSSDRLECSLKRLTAAFGGVRAATLTLDRLTAYVRERLDARAAPGTVWNELKVLRRAFRLAKRAGRVARVPDFPALAGVDRARTGFFEDADYRAVLAELPAPLRPAIAFAYYTGWRIPSEVLSLTWAQVDFRAGMVRLEVGTTKTGEGRTFPFAALPPLEALLERQRQHTTTIEQELGRIVPWVFHRRGKPIRDFHHAWAGACDRAAHAGDGPLRAIIRPSLLGRVPHDLRRTAVRNLERAGVSRSVAMKLTGHKTEAVYRRYAIAPEQDLREGVAKLAELGRGTTGAQSGVRSPEKAAATGTA
jgi:integrase